MTLFESIIVGLFSFSIVFIVLAVLFGLVKIFSFGIYIISIKPAAGSRATDSSRTIDGSRAAGSGS